MKRVIAYAVAVALLWITLCWTFPGCVFFTKTVERPMILKDDCIMTIEKYKSDSAIVRWYFIKDGIVRPDIDTMPFKGVER